MKYFLGIELGFAKLQLAVGDETQQICEWKKEEIPSHCSGEDVRSRLVAAVEDLQTRYRFASVCVGFGGPVDWQQGRTVRSYRMDGWKNFDLGDWLENYVHCPVWIENDANLAAFAEAIQGAGKNYATAFYTKISYGIGGGLIQKGQIYHGARPGELEFGKIRLDKNGATLESVVSGRAISERILQETQKQPESEMAKAVAEGTGPQFLANALEHHDEKVEQLLSEISDTLSLALSHVVHLFHPDIIILGGGFLPLSEKLRDALERDLPAYVMEAFHPIPKLVVAQLKDEAIARGALLMAWQRNFQ